MTKKQVLDIYTFKDPLLREEALMHPSLANRSGKSYERLEFLGDAVLELVISEWLFSQFPKEAEGQLAKRRSALVCGETLSEIARETSLSNALKMSDGEAAAGGRNNSANLENALEAIIGAIYLDGGLEAASHFIRECYGDRITVMKEAPKDPKTALQEWAQERKLGLPVYHVTQSTGPAHAPRFTISVSVETLGTADGVGNSKQLAEREAARALLEKAGVV